jgi:hypothetical protein
MGCIVFELFYCVFFWFGKMKLDMLVFGVLLRYGVFFGRVVLHECRYSIVVRD